MRSRALNGTLAGAVLLAFAAQAEALAPCPADAPARSWRAREGGQLPFACEEQALEFLATADVVAKKELTSGSTRPLKLTLERDGVRAHAIFRHVDTLRRDAVLSDGSRYAWFNDSWRNDVAAYTLSRLLGSDAVPPTVARRVDGREGAVQLWIESARPAFRYREVLGGDQAAIERYAASAAAMQVFDALIGNVDRNLGNMLVDPDGRLHWIDHTRAFLARHADSPPVFTAGLEMIARLRSLGPAELRAALSPWLAEPALIALVERRQDLLRRYDAARVAAND